MGEPVVEFRYRSSDFVRDLAMSYPETTEGTSCVNRAFAAGGKNFVFLGEKDDLCTLRLKLAGGWQKIEFPPDEAPSDDQIRSWIDESFQLLAPARVRKLLAGD